MLILLDHAAILIRLNCDIFISVIPNTDISSQHPRIEKLSQALLMSANFSPSLFRNKLGSEASDERLSGARVVVMSARTMFAGCKKESWRLKILLFSRDSFPCQDWNYHPPMNPGLF